MKQVTEAEPDGAPETLLLGLQSTWQSLTVTDALQEAGSLDDGPWLDDGA